MSLIRRRNRLLPLSQPRPQDGLPRTHTRIGITCYPTYGGSGVVATELGLELAARRDEAHFITYAMPVRMTEARERIHFHEVEMLNYPLFDHPPYALALATQMANVALDLLHVHYAILNFVNCDVFRPARNGSRCEEFAPHQEKVLAHLSNFRLGQEGNPGQAGDDRGRPRPDRRRMAGA